MGSIIAWIIQAALALFGYRKAPAPSQEAVSAAHAASAEAVSQVDTVTATKQAAIAQAEVDAPKTTAAVVDRLNTGTF